MAKKHKNIALPGLIIILVLALVVMGLSSCSQTKQGNGDEITEIGDNENQITTTTGFRGIAFIRDDYVFLANPDGSGERRLTSEASGYNDLSFSPSGGKIAGIKIEGDAMPQLITINVDSGTVTDMSWTNPDYSGVWTAAGVDPWFGGISWASENVLYCTAVKNLKPQVAKYDLSARQVTVIEGDAKDPAVSPDGTKLAYIRKPADFMQTQGRDWSSTDYGDLMIRDLASGSTKMIKGNVFEAVFSPESEHMAAVYFDEPDTALQLTDLQGTRLYTLSHIGPSGTIKHPSFSPGGDRVIANQGWSDTPGQAIQNTIFICTSTSDNPPPTNLGRGRDPSWSPVP